MTRYIPGVLLLGVAVWVYLHNGANPQEPVVLMGLGALLGPDPEAQSRATLLLLGGLGLLSLVRGRMRTRSASDSFD